MARYTKTFLDLIQEEDRIITKLEDVEDEITEKLWTLEDPRKNPRAKETEDEIDKLRDQADDLRKARDDTRRELRIRLLHLFE